jgi:hypothetical protein
MEINYIVLAHKNPLQIKRLIKRLNAPNTYFYIHIDKSVDILPFQDVVSDFPNVFFAPHENREFGTWGDVGIVKATMFLLTQIIKDNRKGYSVLISGQDYPLHNNKFIENFFEVNYGNHFIALYPLPHYGWGEKGGLERLKHYKINLSKQRLDFVIIPCILDKDFYKKKTLIALRKIWKKGKKTDLLKIFRNRKLKLNIVPYGGGQWWAFPIETCIEIVNFINVNPSYLKFHESSLLADEIFFHSILIHIKKEDKTSIKPSVTYVNWIRENTSLPVTFTINDSKELEEVAKTKLFARKFDMEIDKEIMYYLDEKLN